MYLLCVDTAPTPAAAAAPTWLVRGVEVRVADSYGVIVLCHLLLAMKMCCDFFAVRVSSCLPKYDNCNN